MWFIVFLPSNKPWNALAVWDELSFESVNKSLNESYWPAFSCGAVPDYTVEGGIDASLL